MPLSADEAVEIANHLFDTQERERMEFDVLRRYFTGKQPTLLVIPADAPTEVKEMARFSRINIIAIVVNSLTESMFVDGIRVTGTDAEGQPEDIESPVWNVWQANKMDRGQSGLYRAAFTFGLSYVVGTRGEPTPVIRPLSPRTLTALYGDDPDWPRFALERRRDGRFRLYDETHVYTMPRDTDKKTMVLDGPPAEHGSPYCPVVRYRDAEDLDLEDEPEPGVVDARPWRSTRVVAGQVAPLMTLQDQMDMSTFALKGAEWYSAYRQRWIIGWTPADRAVKRETGSSQLWAFDNLPEEIALGEFGQTMLDGYLASREWTAKFAATLSQTPVHELVGELVNLSAEALAAAEAGRDRKVGERKVGMGESHEQLAQLIGGLIGVDVPDDVQIIWKDTSARAFGALIDGLGKISAQLGVPATELWDRIPGFTQQDIRRMKKVAEEGDALANLTKTLDQQAAAGQNGGIIVPSLNGAG